MKKYRIIPLILAAVMAAAPLSSCSKGKDNSSSSQVVNKQEGIAKTEIKAEISEVTLSNDTSFKLNNVIDYGKTDDDGNRFLYLDVTITNNTDKEYELNILNNFYAVSTFHYVCVPQMTNNFIVLFIQCHFSRRRKIRKNRPFSKQQIENRRK